MRFLIKLLWFTLALLFLALGAWFVDENVITVTPIFLGYSSLGLPLGLWLLAFLMLGVMAGLLLSLAPLWWGKARAKRLMKELNEERQALSQLRITLQK